LVRELRRLLVVVEVDRRLLPDDRHLLDLLRRERDRHVLDRRVAPEVLPDVGVPVQDHVDRVDLPRPENGEERLPLRIGDDRRRLETPLGFLKGPGAPKEGALVGVADAPALDPAGRLGRRRRDGEDQNQRRDEGTRDLHEPTSRRTRGGGSGTRIAPGVPDPLGPTMSRDPPLALAAKTRVYVPPEDDRVNRAGPLASHGGIFRGERGLRRPPVPGGAASAPQGGPSRHDPEALDLLVSRGRLEADDLRGMLLDAAGASQGPLDELALEPGDGFVEPYPLLEGR